MNFFDRTREMDRKLDCVLSKQEKLMSALDDALTTLNANDAALKAEVAQVVTYVGDQAAKLAKAISDLANAGVSPEQLAAINAVSADMQTEHDALVAALPPVTPA